MTLTPSEVCLDNHRRVETRATGSNGIDYIDVGEDRKTLIVHLLRRPPDGLSINNLVISGGAQQADLSIRDLRFCYVDDPLEENDLRITLDRPGDRSSYTLRIVATSESGDAGMAVLPGFDPKYSQQSFHFFNDAGMGMDCVPADTNQPLTTSSIDINYLAKDYSSFRQLVLDRLSLIMPGWSETHIADEGIALVEILAYTADYLSYYQDAVATEAYLSTARQRISVHRHVRLLDYAMHEGCNSRAWVQIRTLEDVSSLWTDPASILLVSGFEDSPDTGFVLSQEDLEDAPYGSWQAFQPVRETAPPLYEAHNQILFYTWGNHRCYLPAGATSATLEDPWQAAGSDDKAEKAEARRRSLSLQAGDYLLLEEALGPKSGVAADADPTHRWVVRLSEVRASFDPLNELPILDVTWDKQDALPFPLCLSSEGPAPGCKHIKHVSVARGNVLLVDQGMPIRNELLGTVPVAESVQTCEAEHQPSEITITGATFVPTLANAQLNWRNWPDPTAAASTALMQDPRTALPDITLKSFAPLDDGSGPLISLAEYESPLLLVRRLTQEPPGAATRQLLERLPRKTLHLLKQFDPAKPIDARLSTALASEIEKITRSWTPQRDLLNSSSDARDFVVEMDDARIAHLRFGNGVSGRAPEAGETFFASYRTSVLGAGNVGRETIKHLVYLDQSVTGLNLTIDNPLAASGGTHPEPVDEVKMYAPRTFLTQLDRAITADDYARLAERNPLVQRAAASLVWTGSRYEARVAIDPLGTDGPDPQLMEEIERYLLTFKRIGHDLRVLQAQYVPLDLTLDVKIAPGYLAAHVKRALLAALGNRRLPDGQFGLFHPDRLSFGDSIYASQIIAAAQSQDGVESVTITRLERLLEEERDGMIDGVLSIGPLEIAQLDNDPVHPERGRLRLQMRGGR